MAKISLKLLEFYQLEIELNGFVNNEGQTLVKGLLNENLPLITKYWLNQTAKTISAEKQNVENFKEDLIRKYGQVDQSGNISINKTNDDGSLNLNFVNFQEDWFKLLQEEKEIEYKPIKLEDLETVHSTNNYPLLFKLVVAD